MARALKDSGFKWIREIPEDWIVTRFKYQHNGLNTGESIDKQYWTNEDGNQYFYTAGLEPIHSSYQDFPKWKYTKDNDILLARNGTPYVYFPFTNAIYSDHIIRASIKTECDKRYIRYTLQQSIASVIVETVSIATWSASLWNEQHLPLPPLTEQQKIAAFLDKKCSEIDAVLTKTKESIEEYKLLKNAIITQAVTKGIRPNRKMKDSGIEWIGEIPEDWEDINPKALFSQRKEKAKPGEKQLTSSQQYGIIFQDEYMELTGLKIVTVEKDFDILKHVESGDFVISMRSFQGGLEYSTNTGSISSAYVMLIPNLELVFPRFFRWLLKSNVYIDALKSTSNMVRDGQAMRYSNFSQIRLLKIPLSEQEEIANYLEKKCNEIDTLIAKKEEFVSELETYKKSLIYEYVTGKKEVQ